MVAIFLELGAAMPIYSGADYNRQISSIPLLLQTQMKAHTWNRSCPVSLKDLRHLQISYWGYDDKPHTGSLTVHKSLAVEVVCIFNQLYQIKFPIERMEDMVRYAGDDGASMAANNTSAFNCRPITGHSALFSMHSYGRAIDINPKINPYIKNDKILPSNGKAHLSRRNPFPGKITKESAVYKIFKKYGWDWGGDWADLKDYQHFEKRENGER